MRTKEKAEEVKEEIMNRWGILGHFLEIRIEKDCECDGGEFYLAIK